MKTFILFGSTEDGDLSYVLYAADDALTVVIHLLVELYKDWTYKDPKNLNQIFNAIQKQGIVKIEREARKGLTIDNLFEIWCQAYGGDWKLDEFNPSTNNIKLPDVLLPDYGFFIF